MCGCRGAWSPCAGVDAALESALLGFSSCDPSTMGCNTACYTNANQSAAGGGTAARGMVQWAPDEDRIASSVSDTQGCLVMPLPVGRELRAEVVAPGFMPEVGMARALRTGTLWQGNYPVVGSGAAGLHPGFLHREQPDARNASFVTFQVCQKPDASPTGPAELCYGHGVAGVQAQLLDASGNPFSMPWSNSCYEGVNSPACLDPTLTAVTSNALGYFYNVPPGNYLLRLLPPAGAAGLSCSPDPGNGLLSAWPSASGHPNEYRAHVEAGVLTQPVRAYCVLN